MRRLIERWFGCCMQASNGGAPSNSFGKYALNKSGSHVGGPTWPPGVSVSFALRTPLVSLCSRVWVSFLTGCLVGCSGLTGFRGFGFYLLAHALV